MTRQIGERAGEPTARKRTSAKARRETGKGSGSIGQLMRTEVYRVGRDASANDAARLMWEGDIGVVPVVDDGGKLIGIVTDRDIAMASYLRGLNLRDISVVSLMTEDVISAHASDSIHDVSSLMSRRQVRRVPIVDDQGVLVGIVSLNDLALAAAAAEVDGGITEHEVADALRAISAPRSSSRGDQFRAN